MHTLVPVIRFRNSYIEPVKIFSILNDLLFMCVDYNVLSYRYSPPTKKLIVPINYFRTRRVIGTLTNHAIYKIGI